MEETMEGLDDEDLEEEADEEVDKVLYELTDGKLGQAGKVGGELPVSDSVGRLTDRLRRRKRRARQRCRGCRGRCRISSVDRVSGMYHYLWSRLYMCICSSRQRHLDRAARSLLV